MLPVPPILMHWLARSPPSSPGRPGSASWSWRAGAVLAPGRRTVTAALSVLGRRGGTDFARFHGVLNRARWSGRSLARVLLSWLIAVFVPDGPVVIGIDETIERRWGPKITARGIYRDPVRSSHGHFVKASGLRWVSVMLLAPVPVGRADLGAAVPDRARPFRTLCPASRPTPQAAGRLGPPDAASGQPLAARTPGHRGGRHHLCRHRAARRGASQADHGHAPAPGCPAVRSAATAPTRRQRAARRVTGQRQPTLVQRLADPASRWRRVAVSQWYGESRRELDILTGTAVWDHPGRRVPVRWVLVRDVKGEHDPQAFLCTDLEADALDVLRWFVRRWAVEVTFEEVRRHLGVETQRQWSDKAIARTTPALLALFSLVTLWAHDLAGRGRLDPRSAAWYPKRHLTFSDALGAVRRQLWEDGLFQASGQSRDMVKIPAPLAQRLLDAASFPA